MATTSEVQLDVEAAIAEFIQDGGRQSLELPPMPPGQRKQVKAIVDTYPNLVCESFGIGSDRCLHVFKTDCVKDGAGSVSVKNTFIDDWIAPGDDAVEPVVFRSMPSQLSDSPLPAALSKLDLSPISEGSPKLVRADSFGMTGGKQADTRQPAEGQGNASRRSPGALPTLLGNFQVRNTFIHIDDMSPDERSVQSMPHDMFRQCLQEELDQLGGSAAKPAGQAAGLFGSALDSCAQAQGNSACDSSVPDVLAPGTQVIIQGLTKIPAFNGQNGIVERLDEATGRYSVKLTAGGPGLPKFAKVKIDNLFVAAPLPPPLPFAPTCTVTSSAPQQAYFGTFGDTSATRLKLTALV